MNKLTTNNTKISNFISEYNIMVKDSKNKGNFNDNAINVPINEFIIGSIELKKQYNDSYIIDILENYKGIEIEFKSNYSELSFTFNNSNPNNKDCLIKGSKEISLYNLPNIFCNNNTVPHNWNGIRLKIQVSRNNKEYEINNNSSPYYFRVRPIYDETKNIIEINSDKEIIFNSEQKHIYFMLPLSSWDEKSDLILFTESINIETFSFNTILKLK